jgi:hypothetical protein
VKGLPDTSLHLLFFFPFPLNMFCAMVTYIHETKQVGIARNERNKSSRNNK